MNSRQEKLKVSLVLDTTTEGEGECVCIEESDRQTDRMMRTCVCLCSGKEWSGLLRSGSRLAVEKLTKKKTGHIPAWSQAPVE